MNLPGAVLLGQKPKPKPPARSIVVADRLPKRGTQTGSGAFDATGDVVVDCHAELPNGNPCGWHAMGSRADVAKALADHNRMYHSQTDGPLVALLNDPRRHA